MEQCKNKIITYILPMLKLAEILIKGSLGRELKTDNFPFDLLQNDLTDVFPDRVTPY